MGREVTLYRAVVSERTSEQAGSPLGAGLSHRQGAGADSSALGAEPSALAQAIGTAELAAPAGAEERRANCPGLYTVLYTASEKVPWVRTPFFRNLVWTSTLQTLSPCPLRGNEKVTPFLCYLLSGWKEYCGLSQ
jgi:hypothetical protein